MSAAQPSPGGNLRPTRAIRAIGETGGRRLLIVDDEETIRSAISRFLRSRGYEVETAESGAQALTRLEQGRFSLVLCDVRMPGMSGLEVVPRARSLDPDVAVLMLSGVNDAPTATEALSSGAADYLMKPIELGELQHAVERALHRRDLVIEQRRVEHLIREEVATRTAELEREKQSLRQLSIGVIDSLITAMEAKDVYLRGHSQRVAQLAASIAEVLGLDEDTVEHIRMAGRLHDVGKIGIPESILNKPGKLTPEEFEIVKDHVRLSMQILTPLGHLGPALRYVQDHHEHWDGKGYPRGLAGEDISIGGRVLTAADAFDALTSRRAYREPLAGDATVELLAQSVGTLLDPECYRALATVTARRQALMFLE